MPRDASTCVVTGATGFLGRATCAALLAAGHHVVAVARPDSDRARYPQHAGLDVLEVGDLGDADAASHLGARAPGTFVHIGWAGVAGDERGHVDHVAANLARSVASVELAAATGCRRWVGVGSQAEYGPSPDVLREDSPLRPTTSYGRAKVAAHGAAAALGAALGLDVAWARVFSVYGPGDHPRSAMSYAIGELLAGRAPELGACTQEWDYLYVDDAGEALARIAASEVTGAVNVASGDARPLREAIDLAAAAVGGPARPRYGDAPGSPLRACTRRLREDLAWSPRTPLRDGIDRTVSHASAAVTNHPEPGAPA